MCVGFQSVFFCSTCAVVASAKVAMACDRLEVFKRRLDIFLHTCLSDPTEDANGIRFELGGMVLPQFHPRLYDTVEDADSGHLVIILWCFK